MKNQYIREFGKRALSLLLAAVLIISLTATFAITASAADAPDALRVGSILTDESYTSSALGGTVSIRDIPVTFSDGSASYGFCYQHGAHLTEHTTGYRWITDGTAINALSTAAAPFLAFFYYNLNKGSWSDCCDCQFMGAGSLMAQPREYIHRLQRQRAAHNDCDRTPLSA